MDVDDQESVLGSELGDPQDINEGLELKGDALNDGGFSLGSRAASSASPRASLASQRHHRGLPSSSSSSLASRRRGRSDPPQVCRQRQTPLSSAGSASPVESPLSALSLTTPVRSMRSASTAATSVDPRGDQELLALLCIEDPSVITSLDLSLASKKTKKTLKSLRSLADFASLVQLNAANNAIGSLDGLDALPELTTLCLSRNHIKRIDASLFALVNLKALDLSGNFISHIPRGIAALEVLEELHLAGNNLSALKEMDVLAKLTNLHTCSFAGNPFCKLPTYRDYVVSKIVSLERLDDYVISDVVRDKSRRRFSEEMFSKDKCLLEADRVHESEQSKLRQMQLALEAENVRLKDELQLKSKLLQNKSKAWSSATEQLLQLQHELAMMNLDRRPGLIDGEHDPDAESSTQGGDVSNQPEQETLQQQASQPRHHCRDAQHYHDKPSGSSVHQLQPPSPIKSAPIPRNLRIEALQTQDVDVCKASFTNSSTSPRRTLVDSACSPFQNSERVVLKSLAVDSNHQLIASMMSPHDVAFRRHRSIELEDLNAENEVCTQQPTMRSPTYDDDNGCPAYEDAAFNNTLRIDTTRAPEKVAASSSPLARDRGIDHGFASPLLTPQSRSQRQWAKRSSQFAQETSAKPGHPVQSPRRSQVLGLVEKENLGRQIQALQSCKQSLVNEIANEEQLIHELKSESSSYANQVERMESDLAVLIGGAAQVGFGGASRQREEETLRAKLEMLRNKLHNVEDKESEVEATIVRMTKRVLEEDIQYSKDYGRSIADPQGGGGPFDKEIFALTHKLQMVIVQKEEIHSEMSRIMHQLRGTEGSGYQDPTGLSAEALLLIDQHEQVQRVSIENQAVFLEKQRKVEEFKRKMRDVHERIKIKEDHITALVNELKDIESELAYINDMTPKSPAVHRRALSLDSQSSALVDLAEAAALADAAVFPIGGSGSRRNSTIGTGGKSPSKRQPRGDSEESISSLVEAAAADVNSQFEQKFKELFSPEVLEAIKQDIYAKLSRQLPSKSSSKDRQNSGKDKEDLHAAIAAALETHMKLAMQSYEKQRDDDATKEKAGATLSPPPSPKKGSTHATVNSNGSTHQEVAPERESERLCWDQVDDFEPVDAKYVSKFRFVKEHGPTGTSPSSRMRNSRFAEGEQRILKMCERLDQAETECKIDGVSLMEIDATGKKKSSLKVLIMGARDLPTAHLRTKNLDPYVAVEIVYPEYVLPKGKSNQTLYTGSSMAPLGRLSQGLIDEPTYLPNQSFRSRTVKKSVYPVWDEEFEFAPVHSLKGFLHVRVLNDRKLSREQLVGEARIPLRVLVHQKKVVESFVLRTSPSNGGDRRPSKGAAPGSGTLRMQVQLTFSRIDKYKRALDELVTKFLHESNQLPAFIERIEEYESRLAAPTQERGQEPEEDGTEEQTPSNAETNSVLPTYERWKAQQPAPQNEDNSGGEQANGSSSSARELGTGVGAHAAPTGLSAATRASLWSTPASSAQTQPAPRVKAEDVRRPQPARPVKSQSTPARPGSASASVSAKAAMAQLRQMVKANQSTPATTAQHAANPATGGFSMLHNSTGGSRRKTISAAAPLATRTPGMSPDCFDEYSPYHPDFQLLDPLGVESGGMGNHDKLSKGRSTSYSVGVSSRPLMSSGGDDRRTDLRIFKSPGFSRREPSGSFPERFIGLDSQTSERIKRIFGRIDGQ